MRFMSRTFHLACALLLATAATPLHAAKADRILIVVSGEGRDQGKTRPGYEFDELSQAWLIFQANGFAIDVASPQAAPWRPTDTTRNNPSTLPCSPTRRPRACWPPRAGRTR